MAVWTTKFINDLPDSSFAYIADGGEKDSDGKTTPRSLRELPYKDADAKVDPAHVRNALARLDQTDGIPADKKGDIRKTLQDALAKIKADMDDMPEMKEGMFRISPIELDSQGHLPTSIMLVQTGKWPNSIKGDFEITLDDLKQMKDNFDNGIGFPTEDASTGLAIDFKHEYADEAAGWIKGLELQIDQSTGEGKLFANPIEWTDAGAKAVQGGQFKCVSPAGYFGRKNNRLSMWPDPQNIKNKIANVLDGAGLTNIPFLRGMSPIRADRLDKDASDNANLIYVVTNQDKKDEPQMTLDELRIKEREDLTVPELDFLTEHKSELSADEQKKFKLDEEPAGNEDDENNEDDQVSDEDKATLAAIKDGSKKVVDAKAETVDKDRLTALEATAEQYREEKAQEVIDKHVARGAIKQDASENWKKRLLSATDQKDRDQLESDLEALPDNKILADEVGSSDDTAAGSTPREQLTVIAKKKVEEAAKAGKEVLFADALKEAISENKDLATQDGQEQKSKVGV